VERKPAVRVTIRPNATGSMALYGAQWVGFNRRFGVKVSILWAVESGPVPVYDVSNRFKSLRKLLGRVKPPKVIQITLTDPEHI
jgi:hypothetical protein